MKKILFSALCGLAMITTSCDNDDILIEADNNVNEVNVNVSLSGLFSSYNYNDTQHDQSVTEDFRTFNSEFGKYIHVRTLFYDSQGNLAKELSSFSATTNTLSNSTKLAEGSYTVVTILNFADDQTEEDSWWDLYEKDKLSTAYISPYSRFYKWCIMSCTSKSISVVKGKTVSVSMAPTPVGALGYFYIQNFQYKNEATYGTVADNGVRSIALYSQNVAEGYKLDPNASEKFVYKKATGSNSWYYLSDDLTPSVFEDSKDYGYFRTNLIDYFYILAPSFNAQFGYMLDGQSGFSGYGKANYTITNGQTYLAYWDWFQVGNPYFGVADNNHWNTYSSSQSLSIPFEVDAATHDK